MSGVRRKGTRREELEEKSQYLSNKLRIPYMNFSENDNNACTLLKAFLSRGYQFSQTAKVEETREGKKVKYGFVAIGNDLYNTVSYSEIYAEGVVEEIFRFLKEKEKVYGVWLLFLP